MAGYLVESEGAVHFLNGMDGRPVLLLPIAGHFPWTFRTISTSH